MSGRQMIKVLPEDGIAVNLTVGIFSTAARRRHAAEAAPVLKGAARGRSPFPLTEGHDVGAIGRHTLLKQNQRERLCFNEKRDQHLGV